MKGVAFSKAQTRAALVRRGYLNDRTQHRLELLESVTHRETYLADDAATVLEAERAQQEREVGVALIEEVHGWPQNSPARQYAFAVA